MSRNIAKKADVDSAKTINKTCLWKMKTLVKECWFLLNPLIYVEFGKPCPSGGFIFLFTNATADTGRQYLY